MDIQTLSTAFIGLIAFWATWSVFSCRVRDGVIGKLIYATIALSGYAIATRSEAIIFTPTVAGVTFHGSLALAGMRHIFMVTWWARVRLWLCVHMNCERCGTCVKHPGKRK